MSALRARMASTGLPTPEPTTQGAAVVNAAYSHAGEGQIYIHQLVDFPADRVPTGRGLRQAGSPFAPQTVQHAGYEFRTRPFPIFYPRNLLLSWKGWRQVDFNAQASPYQAGGTPFPGMRVPRRLSKALAYPRATNVPDTYQIDSRNI